MKKDDNTSKQMNDNLYKWVLGVVETNISLCIILNPFLTLKYISEGLNNFKVKHEFAVTDPLVYLGHCCQLRPIVSSTTQICSICNDEKSSKSPHLRSWNDE